MITLQHDYIGDGMRWPVLEGCDQYTLTVSELQSVTLKEFLLFTFCTMLKYHVTLVSGRQE